MGQSSFGRELKISLSSSFSLHIFALSLLEMAPPMTWTLCFFVIVVRGHMAKEIVLLVLIVAQKYLLCEKNV